MKKVGKITIPFRYDLNQTPYNFTVKVTNRFKGLDLIYRVPEELWMEVCDIVQEARIKYSECTVIANTLFQQHKRRLYTWTSPDGQH